MKNACNRKCLLRAGIPILKNTERKIKKMMRKRLWITGLFMPAMIAIVLFAGGPIVMAQAQRPQTSAEVKIDNFNFGPGTLTVSAGTTVTWTNHDDIPHNVVSSDGGFKSRVLDTDEKFSYTFTKAGSFPYFCSLHPKMTGKVVVQ